MTSQKTVLDFCNKHNINCSVENRLLDLVSEIGELSKEVLKASDYGKTASTTYTQNMQMELGDVLFSLVCVANAMNIDMDQALALALRKYEKRFAERAKISSE
jgi:NTP pyrophosphatase (non-canonical NTP hydrolase)